MSLIANGAGESGSSNFYNGVATQSLRFEDGDSPSLSKTFSSAGNRKTWTWSAWVKRGNILGADSGLFGADKSGSSNESIIEFDGNDKLKVRIDGSEHRITTQVFRDSSAWYHIVVVFDTTESTANNRMKIYLNGTQITSFATIANLSQNADGASFNNSNIHTIGRWGNTANFYFDGYMAEMNFVDGTALDASYFGETKNGVWIAKTPDVSEYGTNGFRFKFDQVGVGTASTSTIGADSSGKTNHYTSGNIVASDCNMPDSPENNFPTMNVLKVPTSRPVVVSEGNLKCVGPSPGTPTILSTMAIPTTGKWYAEFERTVQYNGVGIVKDSIANLAVHAGVDANGYVYYDTGGAKYNNNSSASYGSAWSNGDIIGVAYNADDGELTFYKNNSSDGVAYSSLSGEFHFCWSDMGNNASPAGVWNFGQDSSFAGNSTAQGNTDGNGIGDFFYTPPSGFLALCTSNLPEPTIGPNASTIATDHFDILLHTADGSAGAFTGADFQPDWIWAKNRTNAYSHELWDSSRGVNSDLQSDNSNPEITDTGRLVSFDSGGFSYGTSSNLYVNNTASVAWLWKANAGTTTTNDASSTGVGSIDSVFQANTTAGFSIVQYEATGSAGTIAHGLSAAPTFMILKSRDQNGAQWVVYYGDNTDYVVLQATDATVDGESTWNDTSPTSTVFSVGVNGGDSNNSNGGSMIGYIFHDVEGYSKFGSYISNDNAEGPFVFLGFKPAFLLFKQITNSQPWGIWDKLRRNDFNPRDESIRPDQNNVAYSADTQYTLLDFLSNGFKHRNVGGESNSNAGATYIYAAFAEAPFKYSNAE